MKRLLCLIAFCPTLLMAQNPYLPLWEHIPDGEPYVFDDPDQPGHQRIYIYGSHDTRKTDYCGLEQVVWSAPVENPTQWRYDGEIFVSAKDRDGNDLNANGKGDVLFAPDVTVTTDKNGKKTYWLFPNNQAWGRNSQIAKSDRPDGPFKVTNWSKDDPKKCDGILQFDPGVFVDDDGRVYGFYGFQQSWGAELDPATMCTLKTGGQRIENMIPSNRQDDLYRFFEASSMRKIEDKYVFIYSRFTRDGEFGLPTTNYTLAYAYSDYPLGPFTYGGTIIDARARDVDPNGKVIPTANPTGNTHGSLCQINGEWYVFYHRQTGTNEYSRQAMVDRVEVKVEKGLGGRVIISEAEVTSEGLAVEGLNPQQRYPAAIACWMTGGPYVKATYIDRIPEGDPYALDVNVNAIINCNSGAIVGYKYFNMDGLNAKRPVKLALNMRQLGVKGNIRVMIDSPWEAKGGKQVGTIALSGKTQQKAQDAVCTLSLPKDCKGKHGIYFVFEGNQKDKSMAELLYLQVQK